MVESVNVGGDPKPEDKDNQAEHDAAMIAKAEEGVTSINREPVNKPDETEGEEKPAVAERPDNVPEKFWDAEKGVVNTDALLKAQQDAEAALRKSQAKPEEGEDDPAKEEQEEAQESAVAAAEKVFAETGELDEASYQKLEDAGIPRETVEAYIAGQTAVASQIETAAYTPFGGTKESYEAATAWANENMTDDEIKAIDVQLTSTNPAIVAEGAKALHARYASEADISPERTISSSGNSSSASDYFKSSYEMQKAISDPRYSRDASYRKSVEEKIDRADKAGVSLF